MHPAVDGWLVGGVAIVAWLAFTPVTGSQVSLVAPLSAVFVGLGAAHFGATYHLAYGLPPEVRRRHRWALVWVPVAITSLLMATVAAYAAGHRSSAVWAVKWSFILIFTLTGWHYIKQAYGVAMLAARTKGISLERREAMTLRYAFYPVWAVTLGRVWISGAQSSYRNVNVTVDFLPAAFGPMLRTLAIASLVLAGAIMVAAARRVGSRPPLAMWTPYLAGGLWLMYSPGVIGSSVMLGGLHGLQYLACVHRTEIEWAREKGETSVAALWLSLIGGAAAGGLLAATWLPSILDRSISTPALPGLAGSLIFIALNLHHYAMDAAIWRRDGPHLKRIAGAN